jgi:hypothetical protein
VCTVPAREEGGNAGAVEGQSLPCGCGAREKGRAGQGRAYDERMKKVMGVRERERAEQRREEKAKAEKKRAGKK